VVLMAVIAACTIAMAGCGGGDSDGTTTGAQAVAVPPTVTAPAAPNGQRFRTTPEGGSATTPSGTTPSGPGAQRVQRALAPFRDCLNGHGVDPAQFEQRYQQRFQSGQAQRPDPSEVRKLIQASIACIPALPQRLQPAAERMAQRFQQHNG
jgi:hypothetical protein